jgi:parallel beta-helix repeat protein
VVAVKARFVTLGFAALAVAPFIGIAAAQASPASHGAPHTVYVATKANSRAADRSCSTAEFTSLNKAIGAVADGGTVIVCGGTYREDVAVTKSVKIEGRDNPTIDAKTLINGFLVTANHVTISGFTVKNAVGEGVLVKNAKNATIEHNTVTSNDQGVALVNPVSNTYEFCAPLNGTKNDCGENIHLLGATNALVSNNVVVDGSGGILLTDETGPTSHNVISNNTVGNNHTACGVVLAGHNPAAAPGGKPAPKVAGIFDNTVIGNNIFANGLQAGGGAGVQMATAAPGGAVYNNTVTRNMINGNGHPGVAVHSHAPGQDLNGNVVTGNQIGTNNSNGDLSFPAQDKETTGVFVGSAGPLTITIKNNLIGPDHFGVFLVGPITANGVHNNVFTSDDVEVSTN